MTAWWAASSISTVSTIQSTETRCWSLASGNGVFSADSSRIGDRGFRVSVRRSRLKGTFCALVSGAKNPVPGGRLGECGGKQRCEAGTGRVGRIGRPAQPAEAEVLELAVPNGIGISQALDIDAAGQASFNGGLDEFGRKESE